MPWRSRLPNGAALLAAGLLGCSACGQSGPSIDKKPTFPAKGSVFLEGKAVAGAIITLHALENSATPATTVYGRSNELGAFALSTYAKDDGAPAGRYGVTVLLQQGEEGVSLLPPRYADPKTSGLSAEIKPEPNELAPFQLRRR